VLSAFQDIFDICRRFLEQNHASLAAVGSQMLSPAIEEDDFGEIRTAESDAMPQSKEVLECRRTSSTLLSLFVRLRLKGTALASALSQTPKDSSTINAFLSAEGTRFIQLGSAVCSTVKYGTLRLSFEAVDLILASFEEMLSSYAFSKDEDLVCLALSFMSCSVKYWLAPEQNSSEIAERVIYLAKFLVAKAARDQLPSWRVRLAILTFVDEYLDQDPSFSTWSNVIMDDSQGEEDPWGPLAVISAGLLDRDARVRFRATTSAAGLFSLESIPGNQHYRFYEMTMNALPRQPKHWDSFLTDILWKLNCCVSSAQLRAATIYHLYEMPLSSTEYNHHLQLGLEAVARRLGLDGISSLYLPHAALVIRSQLGVNQSPMRIHHRIYGFSSHKAFATGLLNTVTPSLCAAINGEITSREGQTGLAGARELIISLCEAAGGQPTFIVRQHLSTTVALVYANYAGFAASSQRKTSPDYIVDAIKALPGMDTETDLAGLLTKAKDSAGAALFELLDGEMSIGEVKALIQKMTTDEKAVSLFAQLMTVEADSAQSAPALYPSFPAGTVLKAYISLRKAHPSMSIAKLVYATLNSLFYQINNTFLVGQQLRYFRSLALVTALHADEYRNTAILELFLRELVALLDKPDVRTYALAFLKWGFQQTAFASRPMPNFSNIVLRLGAAWTQSKKDAPSDFADEVEKWVAQLVPSWQQDKALSGAVTAAMTLWPPQLAAHISGWPDPTFGELCELATTSKADDPSALIERMLATLQEGDLRANLTEFREHAFWHLKNAIVPNSTTTESLLGFLDLLYLIDGEVHGPRPDSLKPQVNDTPFNNLASRLKKEPEVFLRAVLVDEVVRLSTADDFKTRATALRAFRSLLPYLGDLGGRGVLPSDTIELLSLLLPTAVDRQSEGDHQARHPLEEESLTRKAASLMEWAVPLAEYLCDELAIDDPFYKSIVPLLGTSNTITSGLLPILVQAFLSSNKSNLKNRDKQRIDLLSRHLSAVLQFSSASIDAIRAVVQIVLHLRHFHPLYRTDLLGYDSWLDIDFLLLSEASIRCGAFASALLFLESSASNRKANDKLDLYDPRVQNIMYAIYSNVEDPDGFYGVKTHDVEGALHRQLDHEGNHWRSFGLHGAILESASSGSVTAHSSTAVVRAFHNLGFDHTASAVMKSVRSANGNDVHAEPFFLDLAWRTADWDLPVTSEAANTSQGLLYFALRSLHRERDHNIASGSVSSAIRVELGRLRELGFERMAQIKYVTSNLLCLREVANWLSPTTQRALVEGDIASEALRVFMEIRPSSE